jgi:hypothetical protein
MTLPHPAVVIWPHGRDQARAAGRRGSSLHQGSARGAEPTGRLGPPYR